MREMTVPQEDPRSELNQRAIGIGEFLKARKARDVVVLDLEGLTSITDYFIICTVTSSVQAKAIIRDLELFMKQYDLRPLSRDAALDSPWVLIDYNYFIIHIFQKEGRDYYRLEKLWSDAKVVYSNAGGIP
jgi:ribosome-associated protein